MLNEGIILYLNSLASEERAKKDIYREKAYLTASKNIKDLTYEVTVDTLNTGEKIPGVGDSIKNKLINFLQSPKLHQPQPVINLSQSPYTINFNLEKQKIIELFKSIQEVGNVKAEQWYNKGYRSLGDIKREDCTNNQWVALCNYTELHERIPYKEIKLFDDILKSHLEKINPNDPVKYNIVGSYRRKTKDSGDIDIMFVEKNNRDIMSEILSFPYIIYTFSRGTTSSRAIGGVAGKCRHIDVFTTTEEEYPFALLHYTGSKENNIKLRVIANSKGYMLNEKNLINITTNTPVFLKSEKEIYDFLGVPYVDPEYR